MRPPAILARLLASPPIFFGLTGFTLWSGYQTWLDPNLWPTAFLSLAFLLSAFKANDQVMAYKAWQREWAAMGGSPPPRRMPWWHWPAIFVLTPLLLSLLNHAGKMHGTQGVIGVLMLLIGLPLVIGILGKLALWLLRRHPRKAKARPVTICGPRTRLAAPSLESAYRHLPAHCRQLLGPPLSGSARMGNRS